MDLRDFIVSLFPVRPEDIVIHYKGERFAIGTDADISDVSEQLRIDAEVGGDLDIILEVPSKKRFFRRVISLREVSPMALPLEDRPDMPSVKVVFNPVTLAPERLLLQDQFALPVIRWDSVSINIQNQWPSIDSSYGIPFGSYRVEVGLPELPAQRKRTAEVLLTLSPDLNSGLSVIESGAFTWDYSRSSWSIDEIDPEAFRVFQLVRNRLKEEQSRKLGALFAKQWEEFQKTGSFDAADYASVLEKKPAEEEEFQAYRNTAGYRYIFFVENSLRSFVWDKLQFIYASEVKASPRWWMGCFPESVRSNIKDKMSIRNPILDQLKGEATPLHYCSFNELGQIIEKEWLKIFREKPLDRNAFFGHMSYLEHIRNAIAHNRPLGHEELTILYSNGNSALKMLGIDIPRTVYRNIMGPFTV
jgi:hypothetical protein